MMKVLNVFFLQSDKTKSKLTLTCLPGLSYDNPPSVWPECVPFFNCSDPPLDPVVMKNDWSTDKGTMPKTKVKYDVN